MVPTPSTPHMYTTVAPPAASTAPECHKHTDLVNIAHKNVFYLCFDSAQRRTAGQGRAVGEFPRERHGQRHGLHKCAYRVQIVNNTGD